MPSVAKPHKMDAHSRTILAHFLVSDACENGKLEVSDCAGRWRCGFLRILNEGRKIKEGDTRNIVFILNFSLHQFTRK